VIKRSTLKGQAYDYLKRSIMEESIKAGAIYSEQYFADLLGISRTPVREAILQLSHEGFVEILLNRGIVVREISKNEIRELFQLRTAIEGFCCKYAAENIDTESGGRLLALLQELIREEERRIASADVDPSDFMEHDTRFHLEIASFANNQQIIDIMSRLRSRINLIGIKTLYKPGRLEATLSEHKGIAASISRGDGMASYHAAEHHFNMAKKIILNSSVLNL